MHMGSLPPSAMQQVPLHPSVVHQIGSVCRASVSGFWGPLAYPHRAPAEQANQSG